MIRYLAPIIAFAIMIPVFVIGLHLNPEELPSPYIDHPAPQFNLPELTNPEKSVGSEDYAGEMVLVNVWATWCVGCRQEHGFLLKLARENAIPIFGLNWRDSRDEALGWLTRLGNPYMATGYDADGRVGIDWGVYGAPETFLVSADGTVLYKHISPLNEAVWESEFLPIIRAEQRAPQ